MPKGIYIRTEQNSNLGKHLSEEWKIKLSNANKSKPGWNKGKHASEETRQKQSIAHKGVKLGPFTEQHKRNISKSRIGKPPWNMGSPHPVETKAKISKNNAHFWLGKRRSMSVRLKMSEAQKGSRGTNWKGGITPENERIRHSIEYDIWRNGVFARDGYTCQKYGILGRKLIAHHILNFGEHLELRFAIDNGITLSNKAHTEFHKKYGIKHNTREQLEEFLGRKLIQ